MIRRRAGLRRRTPLVRQITPKRPLEKFLMAANLVSTGAASNAVALLQATGGFTFPGTLTGLRWNIALTSTATGTVQWVIVKVRDGLAAGGIPALGALATMYSPEVDVMAFGLIPALASASWTHPVIEGSTKTMRRMNKGDQLILVVAFGAIGAGFGNFTIALQAFYKS